MGAHKPKTIAVAVGTTRAAIQAAVAQSLKLGLIVQADKANTATIFVGSEDVTTLNGIELAAGESISFNDFGNPGLVNEWDLTKIYFVSGSAGQKARVSYAEATGG